MRRLIIILLCLLPVIACGQKTFKNGIIIDENGDTITSVTIIDGSTLRFVVNSVDYDLGAGVDDVLDIDKLTSDTLILPSVETSTDTTTLSLVIGPGNTIQKRLVSTGSGVGTVLTGINSFDMIKIGDVGDVDNTTTLTLGDADTENHGAGGVALKHDAVIGGYYGGLHPRTGDSIDVPGDWGTVISYGGKAFGAFNMVFGTEAIADGVESSSGGTKTITSANDSWTTGNETVTGRAMFANPPDLVDDDLYSGMDGDNDYYIVRGDYSDLWITEVDTVGYPYSARHFYNYPMFWVDEPGVGITQCICLESTYLDSGYTRIYYEDLEGDSIPNANWITTCRLNDEAGTGNLAGGRWNSTMGESNGVFGFYNWVHAPYSLASGTINKIHRDGDFSFVSGKFHNVYNKGGAAFNFTNTVTGLYATAMNSTNYAGGKSSFAHGTNAKTYYENQIAQGVAMFDSLGDAQGGSIVAKYETAAAATYDLQFIRLEANKSYTGTVWLTCRQESQNPGRKGESASWKFDFGLERGPLYEIDSINLTDDKIYYTLGDTLFVDDRMQWATYTDSTMVTITTQPTGLSNNLRYWVVDTGFSPTPWVQVSTSQGGSVRDITATNANYHTFGRFMVLGFVESLIGSTFADDGDTVGDQLTTGIRADMSDQTYYGRFYTLKIFITGIADRTLRWVGRATWSESGTQ